MSPERSVTYVSGTNKSPRNAVPKLSSITRLTEGNPPRCSNPKNCVSSQPEAFADHRTTQENDMPKAAAKGKANSAFMKPMQPSEHLAKIVGSEPLPRSEVTKKIWAHIKKNKLQNPANKREILADEKLQPIFGGKKLDMFQMTKAVNKHLK